MPAPTKIDDSEITAMLAAGKTWIEIQEALHVGPGRISRVAKATSTSKTTTDDSTTISTTNADVLDKLQFMNQFFKDNLDYLFKSKEIQEFVMNHQEFDEVETLCQA